MCSSFLKIQGRDLQCVALNHYYSVVFDTNCSLRDELSAHYVGHRAILAISRWPFNVIHFYCKLFNWQEQYCCQGHQTFSFIHKII